MPKPQLTQEAVAFIIQVRDDPTTITTWEDISKMVKERFGIDVSLQGIAKSYHRNKRKINTNQIILKANQSSEIAHNQSNKIQAFQEFKKIETRNQDKPKEFVEFDDDYLSSLIKGE